MSDWLLSNMDYILVIIAVIIAFLALVLPLVSLAFSAHRYTKVRQSELKQQRYTNYHDLIHRLVSKDEKGQYRKLDSQIAVIYELRNYQEYRHVSIRILEGIQKQWKNEGVERLLEEISLTLSELKRS